MAKRWEQMTADEKADQLRVKVDQLRVEVMENGNNIAALARHVDEIRNAVKKIEKKLGLPPR